MTRLIHPLAGTIGLLTILAFWLSTAIAELGGSAAGILSVKTGILWGMLLLVPAMAITGGSGFRLGRGGADPRLAAKRRRMRAIALNGLVVLLPSAAFLQARAAAGRLDDAFFLVQGLELLAGALNITLMTLNFRDGLLLARPLRPARAA